MKASPANFHQELTDNAIGLFTSTWIEELNSWLFGSRRSYRHQINFKLNGPS
jgi:hypothetical protein